MKRFAAWPFRRAFALPSALVLGTALQTSVTPSLNNFMPAEDVEMGRTAAAAVRQRLPILHDSYITAYVTAVGQRLADAIPGSVRQSGFDYTYAVLDERNITTVSLPGGPLFVSRGLIELADTDDELAAVMAHELSHIVLRHATAQVSRGERYQIGQITGRSIGTAAGRLPPSIVERAAAFAVSTYFLRYDQEYEREADLLAIEITARAGYRPEDLATILQSMVDEGAVRGGRGWIILHPTPVYGDGEVSRVDVIKRAALLHEVASPGPALGGIDLMQMRLAEIPYARADAPSLSTPGRVVGGVGYGVVPPEGGARRVPVGDALVVDVPTNWQRLPSGNTVTFAPDGAFLKLVEGPAAVTHGLQVGVARSLTGSLAGDTQLLLLALGRDNPRLIWTPAFQHITIARRRGLTTTVSHVSPATGQLEQVTVSTAHLPDGAFLFVIGIAPQDEAGTYRNAFNQVLESLEILD